MSKRKVIYIIQSLGTGGAEVALLSALPALNESFEFRLVCLKKHDSKFTECLSENERKNIVTFDGLPFNYLYALCFILKFKPEILISSLWKGAVLGLMTKCLKPKVKYIEFIHSTIFFHFLDKLFTIWALKLSDVVFCDSTSAKAFANEYAHTKPIRIISFLRFRSPEMFIPKSKIKLKGLFIGRFHEVKRIDRLVSLTKKLVESGLPFELDLYGRDDGTMSVVKELIKEYNLENNMILKGEISSDKIKDLFPFYDFYFQTSAVEGMAMSVVEAMQHGLVCVVTNVGEINNYACNEENAVIISEPFENNLEDAIKQIKRSTIDLEFYNKLSENAYLEFASIEQFCDSLVKELSEI